jgi:hypothetical protein
MFKKKKMHKHHVSCLLSSSSVGAGWGKYDRMECFLRMCKSLSVTGVCMLYHPDVCRGASSPLTDTVVLVVFASCY